MDFDLAKAADGHELAVRAFPAVGAPWATLLDSLNAFYTGAPITRRHVAPAEVGVRRVGHFGYFAERSRETLWRESLVWLRERLSS